MKISRKRIRYLAIILQNKKPRFVYGVSNAFLMRQSAANPSNVVPNCIESFDFDAKRSKLIRNFCPTIYTFFQVYYNHAGKL